MSLQVPHLPSWLAGILDGEAHFRSIGATYPVIQLSMNDEDTMQLVQQAVQELSGEPASELDPNTLPSGKTSYRLWVVGDQAVAVMRQIRPLMSARRTEQINNALREYE